MENDAIKQAWPEWKTTSVLGHGSYGTVYKAERQDKYLTSFSAVKVIHIPWREGLDSLQPVGLESKVSGDEVKACTERVVEEIRIMQRLKGTQNVVNVEDYKVVAADDGASATIFIRMELLTPLNVYFSGREITEEEVIKLGRDICAALKLCEKENVIHRDIKPENIFVNDFGDFKLGDFGIARVIEPYEAGTTSTGTRQYMAPEVAAYKPYDARADLYSLCLTLYTLLNGNQMPFMAEKRLYTPGDREQAMVRRMNGEAFPPPVNASEQLAKVILKGCAFLPEDRYVNAAELDEAVAALGKEPAPPAKPRLARFIIPAVTVVLIGALLLIPRSCENKKKSGESASGGTMDPLDPIPSVHYTGEEDPAESTEETNTEDSAQTQPVPGETPASQTPSDSGVDLPEPPSSAGASSQTVTPSSSQPATPPATTAPPVTTTAPVTYTVTFNANGGIGAPAAQTKTRGKTLTLPAAVPTRDKYVFRGWAESSSAASGAWQAGGAYDQEGNTTLYAVWRRTYTVTFKAGGNGETSGLPASQTKVQGETLYIPTTVPTRSGQKFVYWYSYTTSKKYYPGDPFDIDADTELYSYFTLALS